MASWRVIDTGLRPAAQNIALNRALLEARQAEEIPSTLRFLRFTPVRAARLSPERRAGAQSRVLPRPRHRRCSGASPAAARSISTKPRSAGNSTCTSAMSAPPTCRRSRGASATPRLRRSARWASMRASARATTSRSTAARFPAPAARSTAMRCCIQGTLLVDFDVEKMLRVLRIPAEKLSDKAIASARERVANLKELLGRRPDAAQIRRQPHRGLRKRVRRRIQSRAI